MRRARTARGRGGNNHGRRNDNEMAGPLMTEHIRSLDMELELLKRKRQMIEQQQHLLNKSINIDTQRQFKSPMYGSKSRDGPSSNSQRNFSHMYDDRPQNHNYIPLNSGGRKRPSESQWRENSSPKRFSGPNRGNAKKSFGSRSGPGPKEQPRYFDKPQSLMSVKTKPVNPKPEQRPKFAPNKVSKPRRPAPPNKLATYPVPERKALVAQGVKAINEAMVLHPDREVSQQLNGRLELGLGKLLKDLKERYGWVQPYVLNFHSQPPMRAMKTLIRHRIREAMMGKEVGSLPEIIEQFRLMFPIESDVDIVNEGLQAQTVLDFKHALKAIKSSDNPEQYFKENISLMVEQKLNQMFLKLSEIYSKDKKPGDDIVELTPAEKPKDSAELVEKPNVNKEPVEKLNENQEPVEKPNENQEPVEKPNENQKPVEEPEAIPEDTELTKDVPDVEIIEDDKKEPEVADLTKDDADVEMVQEDKKEEEGKPATVSVNLDRLIEQKLPGILKKYIKHITSLLDFQRMYNAMKWQLAKADWDKPAKKPSPKSRDTSMNTSTTSNEGGHKQSQFVVKVFGRPHLPKRNAMQTFLTEYNPKSIKKHKYIHSLLFVGIDEKEDFDKLLAANGTVIGKSTLEISAGHDKRAKAAQTTSTTDNDVTIVEDTKPEDIKLEDANMSSDEKVLTAELDDQISDLLTSIKKAEEDGDKDTTIEDDDDNVDKEAENADAVVEIDSQNDMTENNDKSVENTMEDNDNPEIIDVDENDEQKDEPGAETVKQDLEIIEETEEEVKASNGVKNAAISVKNDTTAKATPTKTAARAANATPSNVRTRRASRLAQN